MTRWLMVMLAAVMLPGCGGYALKGRVIEGPHSAVLVVGAKDPRLEGQGLGGAAIDLALDPRTLGRKPLARDVAAADGSFAIPISEFGAGFLEHEVGAVVRLRGYSPATGHFMLPGSGKRLLVILSRGDDRYTAPVDPREEIRQFIPQP